MTIHAAAQPKAPRPRRTLAFLSVLIGVIALAGCGSSKSSSSTTSSEKAATTPTTSTSTPAAPSSGSSSTSDLSLSANPSGQLEYNTKSLTANSEKVSIDFTNMAPLGHNVTIENSAGKIVGATPTFQGGSKTLSLDLPPGTYKYFCSVPGHRQAGMEGTLVVK